MKSALLSLFVFLSTACFSQNYYLLAGTYNKPGDSAGIYIYRFNAQSGDATPRSTAPAVNASYFALDKSASHLYVVNELEEGKGAVSGFNFDKKTGTVSPINSELSHGDAPCYISIDPTDSWVATANYTGGNFSVFPVKKDGSLGEAAQTIQHMGKGPDTARQEKPHVHSTVFSPDGKYLTVADLGVDKIYSYPFDAKKEKPVDEQAIENKVAPGSGPRHIIFAKSGRFAYLISEMSGTVTAFKFNAGKFDSIQTINSHPADFSGEKGSAAIRLSPDGKFLYASNRGESNTISIFSVNAETGKLLSVGFQPTGGEHPRDFTIDPSGNFLLVGNMNSGYVSIFKRSITTGTLKDTGNRIKIPKPTNVLFTSFR